MEGSVAADRDAQEHSLHFTISTFTKCDGFLTIVFAHRMSRFDGTMVEGFLLSIPRLKEGKRFQNLRVSSPAPVTIFSPQGLMER